MNINQIIAEELKIQEKQVVDTVALIDEGNTIPFISRYRKEITGDLSDTILRDLEERLQYLRNLEKRKEDVKRLIESTGNLSEELAGKIDSATKLQEVEDLYLPYKPKKRTRATIAKEKGLEPLASLLLSFDATQEDLDQMADSLISEEREVHTRDDAYKGAMDILAEQIAETKEYRDIVRNRAAKEGAIQSMQAAGQDDPTYSMYYEFSEKIKEVKAHRVLAMFRGEKEGILKLKFDLGDESNTDEILRTVCPKETASSYPYVQDTVADAYKRLLLPSIETEIRNTLKENADRESIDVFANNLRPYLMQPPIKDRAIIGLDPGYRTGCKVAVISAYGEYLDNSVIHVTEPFMNVDKAKRILKDFIKKYKVSLIAIGNGTASRETEQFVAQLIEEIGDADLYYTIVNEAGASIYSASKLGDEEFPDLDVTVRGAISIARRIQDPLAELVKIEPQHIGVGQYQHDVNQKELKQTLEKVVEDCVNAVGVNVNTASSSLLSYISGVSASVAKNIVAYKEENGPFKKRSELNKVKGLGPKAYVQCAGFLRIPESKEVLDNTGVHPESYPIAKKLLERDLRGLRISQLTKEFDIGALTMADIIMELRKPGRDPRDEMPKPILRSDVLSIDDLVDGMEMLGTVRNVVDFGAFVDIGIKNDGLVHISQMSNKFIQHPKEVVKVSDIVKVKIIGVDKEKGKVSLSMKGLTHK